MKKYFRFILAAMAMTAMASCAEELEDPTKEPVDVELVPMTITVGSDTKTHFAEDGKTVNWCETDEIAVFDKVGEKRRFTIKEGSVDGKQAIFEGQVAAGTTDYCAVYPYSAAGSCSDGKVVATTPLEQTISGKNVADGAIVAVGKSKVGQPLQFRNVVGVFKFEVTYTDVTEIYLEGNAIAGQAQFDAATGEVESGTVENASAMVTLKPSGEKFATGTYYIPLLPGTTEAGKFMITMAREGDMGAVYTIPKDVTVPRNDGFIVDDTKLTETFLIKDAVTLQTFLTAAKDYKAGQHATIVKDIDLTGVTLTPATKFLGTLDGRNHSLKNWTSDGVALFNEISYTGTTGATVRNLKIDESCKLTPLFGSEHFGFIARMVSAYSVLENCENRADVKVTAETMGTTYFGTLVGKSYGIIRNCRNTGDVELNITGDVTANVYMGCIMGYSNIQTQSSLGGEYVYCMKDCQNDGDFLFTVGGYACHVFLGGVASGTSCGALSETSANKGTFKNCLNTGTVQYIVKNGASLEDNAGAAGKNDAYINMGGVVGYCEGSLESCVNRGPVKMQGPTLESAWALKRGAVGGVSGFVLFSVTDCENYGTVSAKSTWVNGTEKTAGAGNTSASSFGGVVGQAGLLTTAAAADYTFSGNHNHGALSFTDWMPSVNNSGAYFGGVVGYSTMKVTECSNNATMDVDTKTGHTYLGGVVGQCTAGVESLTNSGDLNVLAQRTTSTYTTSTGTDGKETISVTGQLGTNFRVGGVVAVVSNDKMVNSCTNNNAVTVNIKSVDLYVAQVMVGGVLGRATCTFKNNINNGKVTVNQDPNTKGITLGGVVGWLQGAIGITKGENNGAVAYNAENSPATSYIGGFAGYINSTEGLSGVKNTAPVTVNHGGSGGACRVGGVIGHLAGSAGTVVENLVNTETGVVSTTHLPKYFDAGGVIGRADKMLTFKSLSNAAPVRVSAPDVRSDWFTVGGVMGRNTEESTYNGCSNSGDITVDVHTNNTGYCYVHGIAGEQDSSKSFTMTDNTNTGDIYVDCADTKCGWQIGGITSYCGGAGTNSGNVCKADITLVGTSTAIHNVGGIMGYCARSVYENCTYEGTITTNGAASGQFGYLGGIVGRSNNATMNFRGCTLKAVIKYGANSYGGVLDGDLNIADRTANIGVEGKVTKILSGSSVNGTAVTSALEDNLLVGTRLARTVNKTYCQFVTE